MNRIIFFIYFFFLNFNSSDINNKLKIEISKYLDFEKLKNILTILEIEDVENIERLNYYFQENWFLGKNNKERWQSGLNSNYKNLNEDKKNLIFEILKDIFIYNKIKETPDVIIVFGATLPSIIRRASFILDKNINKNTKIIFLSGYRTLDETVDKQKEIEFILKNKFNINEIINNEYDLFMCLKKILNNFEYNKIICFNEEKNNNNQKRATTESTLKLLFETFKELNNKNIKILAISNSIYIPYQQVICDNLYKKKIIQNKITIIGPNKENGILDKNNFYYKFFENENGKIDRDSFIKSSMDTIARIIFTLLN
jgi:hypothetical protein